MCACQWEIGFTVIKSDLIPASGFVAGRTACAELAVMGVVLFMTGVAVGGRSFEDMIGMALITGDRRVGTG